MDFYCPSCQESVTVEPVTTVTTKFNQTYFKATCPECQQDLACHAPVAATTQPSVQPTTTPSIQAEMDQALKEFGTAA